VRIFHKFIHDHSYNTIYPFTLYKRISEQYNNKDIMNLVKGLVPDSISKLYYSEQDLKPILQWFKADFMMWMPKLLKCKKCDTEMDIQIISGSSWKLRATEIYSCKNCGLERKFPRYGEIRNIAMTRVGRCSEWSMLFGAILNSMSIKSRLVYDFLDHCWNESLINGKWLHVDSTLEFPISLNHPHYYEQNWGKKYRYVLAFSSDNLEDVTMRYSEEWNNVLKRRDQKNVLRDFTKIYSRL
jgi:peptide-N4-(N-acetyl-beta-glucosaminyl)asparagine amidase